MSDLTELAVSLAAGLTAAQEARTRYWSDPERHRAARRVENLTPEQREAVRKRDRERYTGERREKLLAEATLSSRARWAAASMSKRKRIYRQRRKAKRLRRAAISLLRAVLDILDGVRTVQGRSRGRFTTSHRETA